MMREADPDRQRNAQTMKKSFSFNPTLLMVAKLDGCLPARAVLIIVQGADLLS